MSTLKVDQLEAATASTITVPSGQTLDISSATLTPPATMPASSAANLTSIPAGNLTGTVADARISALTASKLTGALPAISGASLTNTGGLKSVQVFTSTDTWTKPSGITTIRVYVTGGGGGGGGTIDSHYGLQCGSGGAAGGTAIKLLDVTDIDTCTVTIGSSGSASSGSSGGAGGTSSFAKLAGSGTFSTVSATGGTGGERAGAFGGAVENGGVGSGGDINLRGCGAGGAHEALGGATVGPSGGSSYWSGGGYGVWGSTAGDGEHGSGGGACGRNQADGSGGAGGAGMVYIEEYV